MNKIRDSGIYGKLACDSGSRPPLPDPGHTAREPVPKTSTCSWYQGPSPFMEPAGQLCGAFVHIVSPGGRALAYPRATPRLLTHTWFLTLNPNVKVSVGNIGKEQLFITDRPQLQEIST